MVGFRGPAALSRLLRRARTHDGATPENGSPEREERGEAYPGEAATVASLHPSGDTLRTYKVVGLLGRGAFADVWLCQHRAVPGMQVACKVVDISKGGRAHAAVSLAGCNARALQHERQPGDKEVAGVNGVNGVREDHISASATRVSMREVSVLQELQGCHVGIVQLHEVHRTEDKVEMLLEHCEGGDLAALIRRRGQIPEAAAKVLFRQLVSAVKFCHSAGVVHRDIKPENVLFVGSPDHLLDTPSRDNHNAPPVQVKLADFGVAVRIQGAGSVAGEAGTRSYCAPEVVKGFWYAHKADIWSLGAVLYAMLSGTLPPSKKERDQGRARSKGPSPALFWAEAQKGAVNLDALGSSSVGAQNLICRMMHPDPQLRLSAAEALKHPWLLPAAAAGAPLGQSQCKILRSSRGADVGVGLWAQRPGMASAVVSLICT